MHYYPSSALIWNALHIGEWALEQLPTDHRSLAGKDKNAILGFLRCARREAARNADIAWVSCGGDPEAGSEPSCDLEDREHALAQVQENWWRAFEFTDHPASTGSSASDAVGDFDFTIIDDEGDFCPIDM